MQRYLQRKTGFFHTIFILVQHIQLRVRPVLLPCLHNIPFQGKRHFRAGQRLKIFQKHFQFSLRRAGRAWHAEICGHNAFEILREHGQINIVRQAFEIQTVFCYLPAKLQFSLRDDIKNHLPYVDFAWRKIKARLFLQPYFRFFVRICKRETVQAPWKIFKICWKRGFCVKIRVAAELAA